MLWRGPFKQRINTAVESGFADQRDYLYEGEVVDHQTHLGFDLASTAAALRGSRSLAVRLDVLDSAIDRLSLKAWRL